MAKKRRPELLFWTTLMMAKNKNIRDYAILVILGVGVLTLLLTDFGKRLWLPQAFQPGVQNGLIKSLRLEAAQPGAFEEVELALRAFHYRTQLRDSIAYSYIFFDSDDWQLYRNGIFYFFRNAGNIQAENGYSLQLERKSQLSSDGSKEIDMEEPMPKSFGIEIAQGFWERALSSENGNRATAELLTVLQNLHLSPSEVRPRLAAELHKERYDITDKGRSWFWLDRERWSFHSIENADRIIQFEDFVIVTQPNEEEAGFVRRVVTVNRLSEIIYGAHVTGRSPQERAMEELGFLSRN